MKLFCCPCAGGTASMFHDLENSIRNINNEIDIELIEYAGRGELFNDGFDHNIEGMVNRICNYIVRHISGDDSIAILGYSMGSIIALEVYYKLVRILKNKIVHMFFLAHNSPFYIDEENLYFKNDKQLIDELIDLGGFDDEIIKCDELMDLFIERMRADLKIYSKYQYNHNSPIDCNASVLYCPDDNKNGGINKWSFVVGGRCDYFVFEGPHFFINTYYNNIAQQICDSLLEYLSYPQNSPINSKHQMA